MVYIRSSSPYFIRSSGLFPAGKSVSDDDDIDDDDEIYSSTRRTITILSITLPAQTASPRSSQQASRVCFKCNTRVLVRLLSDWWDCGTWKSRSLSMSQPYCCKRAASLQRRPSLISICLLSKTDTSRNQACRAGSPS